MARGEAYLLVGCGDIVNRYARVEAKRPGQRLNRRSLLAELTDVGYIPGVAPGFPGFCIHPQAWHPPPPKRVFL